MIKLKNCQPAQLLPQAIRGDPKVQAAGYAMHKIMEWLITKADGAAVYPGAAGIPDGALDILAGELRAQYYDTTLPAEGKKEAIKKAMAWHCKAGTAAAVKELAALVWGEGDIRLREWHEYGAEPYLFRLELGTETKIEGEKVKAFTAALMKTKNTRSHLDALTFKRRTLQGIHIAAAGRYTGRIVIADVWGGEHKMEDRQSSSAAMAYMPKKMTIREG